jgi:hypothetical protein
MPIEGIDTGQVGVDETETRRLARIQGFSQLGNTCLNDIEVIHRTTILSLSDVLERGFAAREFTTEDCGAAAMRILAMIDGTFAQSAVRTAVAGTALLNYPVVAEMLLRATEQDLGPDACTLD